MIKTVTTPLKTTKVYLYQEQYDQDKAKDFFNQKHIKKYFQDYFYHFFNELTSSIITFDVDLDLEDNVVLKMKTQIIDAKGKQYYGNHHIKIYNYHEDDDLINCLQNRDMNYLNDQDIQIHNETYFNQELLSIIERNKDNIAINITTNADKKINHH